MAEERFSSFKLMPAFDLEMSKGENQSQNKPNSKYVWIYENSVNDI